MAAPAETIERAYELWRECGQNMTKTVRALDKEGYSISRQTLTAWRDDHDWRGRAARAENEKKKTAEAITTASLTEKLLEQKRKYEEYFETLRVGTIDNQAIYGYNSILKTLVKIREESGDFKADVFGRFFRDLVEYLRVNDPPSAAILAEHFDDFTAYIRKKYVS